MGSVEPSVAETSSAIRVRGLDHWFGEGEAKKQVLYDITLDNAPGKLTILILELADRIITMEDGRIVGDTITGR